MRYQECQWADTKANTRELVREAGSLRERLQRGVALESLGKSGSSFRAESVPFETASMGAGEGAESCQWALTQKRTLWGRGALEAFDLRLREDFHELEQA